MSSAFFSICVNIVVLSSSQQPIYRLYHLLLAYIIFPLSFFDSLDIVVLIVFPTACTSSSYRLPTSTHVVFSYVPSSHRLLTVFLPARMSSSIMCHLLVVFLQSSYQHACRLLICAIFSSSSYSLSTSTHVVFSYMPSSHRLLIVFLPARMSSFKYVPSHHLPASMHVVFSYYF